MRLPAVGETILAAIRSTAKRIGCSFFSALTLALCLACGCSEDIDRETSDPQAVDLAEATDSDHDGAPDDIESILKARGGRGDPMDPRVVPDESDIEEACEASARKPPVCTSHKLPPPETVIVSAVDGEENPLAADGTTTSTSVTFSFGCSSSPPTPPAEDPSRENADPCRIECSHNEEKARTCGKTLLLSGLSVGRHRLSVWAIDPAGQKDPDPATFSWDITPVPPPPQGQETENRPGDCPAPCVEPSQPPPPAGSRLALGREHTCVLLDSKEVSCWGTNTWGQLGSGETRSATSPQVVSDLSGVAAIAAGTGSDYTCALLEDATVRCWGFNGHGQTGSEKTGTGQMRPVQIQNLSSVVGMDTGYAHTCAVTTDGSVYCWGDNQVGQLGNGTSVGGPIPVKVTGIQGVVAVSAGGWHSCAVRSDGTVQCWGMGGGTGSPLGEGDGIDLKPCDASWAPYDCTPVPVPVPGLTGAVGISAGGSHTCALLRDDSVSCWGFNSHGQLGDGTERNNRKPVAAISLAGVKILEAGWYSTCALTTGGQIKCWGWTGIGGIWANPSQEVYTPTSIYGLGNAKDVSSGWRNSCALLTNGDVRCWGANPGTWKPGVLLAPPR